MQAVYAKKKEVKQDLLADAKFCLSMYARPPAGELSLEEFEQYSMDRLRVLKALDAARANGQKGDALKAIVTEAEKQYALNVHMRKDTISHHTLRIAYCRSEDLRRWFLTQETSLFRHRFETAAGTERERFLKDCALGYETLQQEEFDEVKAALHQMVLAVDGKPPTEANPLSAAGFYKVPFEDVHDLVAQRRVFLKAGLAYVRAADIVSLLVNVFRTRLSRSLADCARTWHAKEEEEADRLAPLLRNLTNSYLGPSYAKGGVHGEVSLEQIDELATRSFPLCMRELHSKLRSDHHLRHGGRMQFGLFLKAIGVSMEDSLTFWRQEFTKGMPEDKFEKQYAYNIRHNYGQAGKRTDYSAYSCNKIIQNTPAAGDFHGCPFRHWDETHLVAQLQSMNLPGPQVREIADKAKGGHYQVACYKLYEATHPPVAGKEPVAMETLAVPHPNTYFDTSLSYWKAQQAPEQPAQATAQ